ncbi:MAG: dynamin family protein [Candidatus Spyradocola sp.]
MRRQDVFASAQTLVSSPVLKETSEVKACYYRYLRRLLRLAKWDGNKYAKAQIAYYKGMLLGEEALPSSARKLEMPASLCYLLPFDIAQMTAFHPKASGTEKSQMLIGRIAEDFHLPDQSKDLLAREFAAAVGDPAAWRDVYKSPETARFKRYLQIVENNVNFIGAIPYNILITANMSAGKSTLINALVGKNISLTQNLACTSKVHTIVSKPFEDGVTSEYDHDLQLNASREDLLSDSEENLSTRITVGTYFHGGLGGERITLLDTPGVNSSENEEHREISNRMIRSKRYRLLLYVMNATQLGTNDEDLHLETVQKVIGRKSIVFVINKIDNLVSEDDDLLAMIENQRRYLISKGFRNPVICPISARAAYLAKKSQREELNRLERGELENLADKFDQTIMAPYYRKQLRIQAMKKPADEADALLLNSGFAYLEKIIKHLINGGKINGTGIC